MEKVITKEALKEFEIKAYEGNIKVVTDEDEANSLITRILQEESIIGFDTETRPTFKKGPLNDIALVQLASKKEVVLIRLKKTRFISALKNLLESPNHLIVGIGLEDDMRELRKIRPFTPRKILDLNKYCSELGFESIGAVKLTALILGFRISKRQQISNWEAPKLSPAQILYAATDAWICREIFLKLQNSNEVSKLDIHNYTYHE